MLKFNLKCIYSQYWQSMKATNSSKFCFVLSQDWGFALPCFCTAPIPAYQMPRDTLGKNQNIGHIPEQYLPGIVYLILKTWMETPTGRPPRSQIQTQTYNNRHQNISGNQHVELLNEVFYSTFSLQEAILFNSVS